MIVYGNHNMKGGEKMLELELMTKENATESATVCSPACIPTDSSCPPLICNPANPCPPRR